MKYPIWKPLIILGVLVLLVFAFLVPATRVQLRQGIDLAGGTTLLYDVRLPPDTQNPTQEIDEMILVLRNRVDPTGTRNLVWRQVAGNRIEIQMALTGEEIARPRENYLEAKQALLNLNLQDTELDALLAMPADQQPARAQRLAEGDEELLVRLNQLLEAQQTFLAAVEPYQQGQQELREARQSLRNMSDTADESQREQMESHIRDLQRQLVRYADRYYEAQQAIERARGRVLVSNISERELDRILELSTRPSRSTPDAPSAREQAITELQQAHPDRAELIERVATAFASYEQVRGPLDDYEDLIAILQGSGVLEFRIAARAEMLTDESEYRERLRMLGPRAGGDQPWRWFEVDDITKYFDARDPIEDEQRLAENPAAFFRSFGMVGDEYGGTYYLLLSNADAMSITRDDQGWELASVMRGMDQDGTPAIHFTMNPIGGELMYALTRPNVGQPMAILLDNKVVTSPPPNIREPIGRTGQITGRFSSIEIDYLIRTLKSGSIRGQLSDRPISIVKTGPAFGQDNLERGSRAAVYALVAVALFMMAYYLFGGLITAVALLMNMGLILGVMALIQATFTLPGIAGIILTIGMAVDANILIFERIREEMEQGADLKKGIRLGFDKALSTILDANITTLITCVVLYYMATAEIKGFALTLGIGIMATLFSSLFCTRVVLEMYEAFGGRKFPSLPTVIPALGKLLSPSVNWLKLRPIFFPISAVLLVVGLGLTLYRGEDMLDIEFRAGTQVSFNLKDGEMMPVDEARARVAMVGEVAGLMNQAGFDPSQLTEEQREVYQRLQPVVEDVQQRYEQQVAQDARHAELEPMPNLALLTDASVVTLGDVVDGQASSFSVATLVTDPQAVGDAVKVAFEGMLEGTRPVNFINDNLQRVRTPPVFPITQVNSLGQSVLGENIDQPRVTTDVTSYLGGVAILLQDMEPAVTAGDLELRIDRMRRNPLPQHMGIGPWDFQVVGIEQASITDTGERTFRSAVVLLRDDTTNYMENPDALADTTGLAQTGWEIVSGGLKRDQSLDSVSNFSSQVSATMKQQAIASLTLALLAVVAYIWIRFGGFGDGLIATALMIASLVLGGVIFIVIQLAGMAVVGEAAWNASLLRLLLIILFVPLPLVLLLLGVIRYYPHLRYGPAAIIALIHDISITLGLIAICGWVYDNGFAQFLLLDPFKINLALVAACLTIVGYSLNDTIVIFDRIRENRGKLSTVSPDIINQSINQTFSRTILTSTTTLIAVLILYIFGGPGVHGFAFAMMIGVLVGTYSSIVIASPILLIGGRFDRVTAVREPEKAGGTVAIGTSTKA